MGVQRPRMREIKELLQREQQVTIRELSARFAVSTMTIRRDLEWLEAQGFAVRTFGGAVVRAHSPGVPAPVPLVSPAKQAIGALAASLVERGQTIVIDAGTTTLEVVRHLPRDAELTLVMNSLQAAQEMLEAGIHVLLLGGYLSREHGRSYGPMTEACLAQLHADLLFVGCVGAGSTQGFYMSDLYLTSNVQAMVRAAERVIVVAESAKFRQRALSCYALPREVAAVVTDSDLAETDRRQLEEQGVTVYLASKVSGSARMSE